MDYDDNYIEEKIIPVAGLHSHGITLFISESGKFYRQTGWIGNDVLEAFENIILQKGGRHWKEIRYKKY